MNAARLARRLDEAKGDNLKIAEAIVDEVTDPATGLVTRDHLDARLAEMEARLERRLGELGFSLTWRILALFTGQIAVFTLIVRYLTGAPL
jgi:PleD family two-component response regulator